MYSFTEEVIIKTIKSHCKRIRAIIVKNFSDTNCNGFFQEFKDIPVAHAIEQYTLHTA